MIMIGNAIRRRPIRRNRVFTLSPLSVRVVCVTIRWWRPRAYGCAQFLNKTNLRYFNEKMKKVLLQNKNRRQAYACLLLLTIPQRVRCHVCFKLCFKRFCAQEHQASCCNRSKVFDHSRLEARCKLAVEQRIQRNFACDKVEALVPNFLLLV